MRTPRRASIGERRTSALLSACGEIVVSSEMKGKTSLSLKPAELFGLCGARLAWGAWHPWTLDLQPRRKKVIRVAYNETLEGFRTRTRIALTSNIRHCWFPWRSKVGNLIFSDHRSLAFCAEGALHAISDKGRSSDARQADLESEFLPEII